MKVVLKAEHSAGQLGARLEVHSEILSAPLLDEATEKSEPESHAWDWLMD